MTYCLSGISLLNVVDENPLLFSIMLLVCNLLKVEVRKTKLAYRLPSRVVCKGKKDLLSSKY